MKIDRQKLVSALEAVSAGLASRELVEQSTCFVFKNGQVVTYNEEVACFHPCDLKIEGAIPAKPMLALLKRLEYKNLIFEMSGNELRISTPKTKSNSKRGTGGLAVEPEITLPVESIKMPKRWHAWPKDMTKAILLVRECAGTSATIFETTCLHFYPEHVEACNNHEALRHKLKTKFKKPCSIRKTAADKVIQFEMVSYGETRHWIHCKTKEGMILACRKFSDALMKLDDVFATKGRSFEFEEALKTTAEQCSIFSEENAEGNRLLVELKKGMCRVTGRGITGWWSHEHAMEYDGKSQSFQISPVILQKLATDYSKCSLSTDKVKATGKGFIYIASLMPAEEVTRS